MATRPRASDEVRVADLDTRTSDAALVAGLLGTGARWDLPVRRERPWEAVEWATDDWDSVDWVEWWDHQLSETRRIVDDSRFGAGAHAERRGGAAQNDEVADDARAIRKPARDVAVDHALNLADEVLRREATLAAIRPRTDPFASPFVRPSSARRHTVGSDATAHYRTIRSALDHAREGDEIVVGPGLYREALDISLSVSLVGAGPRDAIVIRRPAADVQACIRIWAGEPELRNLRIECPVASSAKRVELPGLIAVLGGAPRLLELELAGAGVEFRGEGTAGVMAGSAIHDSFSGIWVRDGASPRIEGNELWSIILAAVEVRDVGTAPVVVGNRIHNEDGGGILVHSGASPRVEDNELSGIALPAIECRGAGTVPMISGNRIHDCMHIGIHVHSAATPRLEGNEVWGTVAAAIAVCDPGTNPDIRANQLHDGLAGGISVFDGASPRIEGNVVCRNAHAGVAVRGLATDPAVLSNKVHENASSGIWVHDGACPRIEENEIWANELAGIEVGGRGTRPQVLANRIFDGESGGVLIHDGATPQVGGNEVWGNALAGVEIQDGFSDPIVWANRVHDGLDRGILVHGGASPRLENNDVWANAGEGIVVDDAGSNPILTANHVHENDDDGIYVSGGSPTIVGNRVLGNAFMAIRVEEGATPTIRDNTVDDG